VAVAALEASEGVNRPRASSVVTTKTGGEVNNSLISSPSPQANTTGSHGTFQATITGYGGNCADPAAGSGSCDFLGVPNSFQAAVSTYWKVADLPSQCGTCWKLTDGTNINGDGSKSSLIGTAPIVVMIDNKCA